MYGKEYHEWQEDLKSKDACEREIILALIQVAKRYAPEIYERAVDNLFPKPQPQGLGLFGTNPLYERFAIAAQQRAQQQLPSPFYAAGSGFGQGIGFPL